MDAAARSFSVSHSVARVAVVHAPRIHVEPAAAFHALQSFDATDGRTALQTPARAHFFTIGTITEEWNGKSQF